MLRLKKVRMHELQIFIDKHNKDSWYFLEALNEYGKTIKSKREVKRLNDVAWYATESINLR